MTRLRLSLPLFLLTGCVVDAVVIDPNPGDTGGEDTGVIDDTGDPDDTGGQQCGDITTWDVTLQGVVHDRFGQPVQGATVELDDRGWEIGVVGSDTTNGAGEFSIRVEELTSIEDCWGTVLNYVVTAADDDRYGERGVNLPLYNAIENQTYLADITAFPLEID